GPTPAQIEVLLSTAALVVAGLVVAAGLALAAADARDERDVLTVVGAGPGALVRAAGARAWLLAGLGAVMAVPFGLLPVAVYVAVHGGTRGLVVPCRTVGLVAVALPVALARPPPPRARPSNGCAPSGSRPRCSTERRRAAGPPGRQAIGAPSCTPSGS